MEVDNKLEKLYQTVANCEEFGIELPQGVLDRITELEEEIIKKEVLPVINNNIETALSQVKRPIVLVVDYNPETGVRVSISRRVNITSQLSDAKSLSSYSSSHPRRINSITSRGPRTGLEVIFGDGTVIHEWNASETFGKVFQHMGVERVFQVVEKYGIRGGGGQLISKNRIIHPQVELGHGYLLNTSMNNHIKKEKIERIARLLQIKVTVIVRD